MELQPFVKGRWNADAETNAGNAVARSPATARTIPRSTKFGIVQGRCSFQERECCRRIVSRSSWPRPAFAASYSSSMFFGTPTKTSPPVGGTSFRIPLPVVVFPHPLSPTRQKISPLPTSRSTPSTARTYSGVAFRSASRNPRRFSNQTRKSRRTRYGSRANSHRLLRRWSRGVQVAGGEVACSHGVEPRLLVDAQLPRVLASRVEAAPDRRVDQRRQEAGDVRGQGLGALDVRERADEIFRVRVLRVLVDVADAPALDDLPGVHDRHRVAGLRHDAEVVGDQDHREVEFSFEAFQQFEDLRLDHDVQRRYGLVRDDDLRIAREGHRDHYALSHAAGELVRVFLGALAVDPDELEELPDAFHRRLLVHLVVDDDRLRDLVPDPLHRVQRVHRALEDDRDVLPSDPAQLAFRDFRKVIPNVFDRPVDDLAVRWQEAHDRQGGRRLAAAALPRESEALALTQGEVDAVDGPNGPFVRLEVRLEAPHGQERHVTAPRDGSDEFRHPFFGACIEDAGNGLNVFSVPFRRERIVYGEGVFRGRRNPCHLRTYGRACAGSTRTRAPRRSRFGSRSGPCGFAATWPPISSSPSSTSRSGSGSSSSSFPSASSRTASLGEGRSS